MKDPLYRAIESHWREYRPKMVTALKASGKLESAIEYAADRTAAAESSLIQQGVSPQQAQERMREEWAFLPSEEDSPDLPNGDPEAFLPRYFAHHRDATGSDIRSDSNSSQSFGLVRRRP